MKKLLLALAFMLPACSFAQTKKEEACRNVYDIAYTVMQARQLDIDIIEVKNELKNIYEGDSYKLAIMLTDKAYASHFYASDEYKERTTKEFAKNYYLLCLEVRK